VAGSVNSMFDFTHRENRGEFLLHPGSGEPLW